MFAAAGGYKEVAELLLAEKAEVNARVKATPEYKEQVMVYQTVAGCMGSC